MASIYHYQVPVSHFAAHCQRRLERISQTGAKKGLRKPTMEEIEQAKVVGVVDRGAKARCISYCTPGYRGEKSPVADIVLAKGRFGVLKFFRN